jgi:2-methylcitrate dehydratase
MTRVREMAEWLVQRRFEDLSAEALDQMKLRVADAMGCAIGAQRGVPVTKIREQLEDFGGRPLCTLIGGGRSAPDRAALYNGALVRYLDFNDSYLAPGETCHPSDNLAAVLAAAEYAHANGKTFLKALAAAYQVQCRLSDEAPVRAKGFDHTTQGAYAAAAGAAVALGLDPVQTANALAISGTAYNALRVTRTGTLSHWKGLAYPNTAFGAVHAAFLAMRGITGPPEVFEGNKGFMEAVSGPFEIDWRREDLERVRHTIVKKYNAEIHSQATLEGTLELRSTYGFDAGQIAAIQIDTFDVAFHIIGGGEEGDKAIVRTKEEADHSLPYMVAVALLDGQVLPAQYLPKRIVADDVQQLLRKIEVRESARFSERFPDEMGCRISIRLKDGRSLWIERKDYEGFHTRPIGWETAWAKFSALGGPHADEDVLRNLFEAVQQLENLRIEDLTGRIANIGRSTAAGG